MLIRCFQPVLVSSDVSNKLCIEEELLQREKEQADRKRERGNFREN